MDIQSLQETFPSFEPALKEDLLLHCDSRLFKAGESLLRSGQSFRATMLIVAGLVKVYRQDDDGNEFFIYYLQPGQACALSMVCATRQQTSGVMAKAVKDTEVLAIPLSYMDIWMTQYKTWYHFVQETYRSRFEELLVTLDHTAFRAMDERLEFYLRQHQQSLQQNTIEINHQQIADELNSSREVISRLLKKMEQLGKIKLHRNAVEIVQL